MLDTDTHYGWVRGKIVKKDATGRLFVEYTYNGRRRQTTVGHGFASQLLRPCVVGVTPISRGLEKGGRTPGSLSASAVGHKVAALQGSPTAHPRLNQPRIQDLPRSVARPTAAATPGCRAVAEVPAQQQDAPPSPHDAEATSGPSSLLAAGRSAAAVAPSPAVRDSTPSSSSSSEVSAPRRSDPEPRRDRESSLFESALVEQVTQEVVSPMKAVGSRTPSKLLENSLLASQNLGEGPSPKALLEPAQSAGVLQPTDIATAEHLQHTPQSPETFEEITAMVAQEETRQPGGDSFLDAQSHLAIRSEAQRTPSTEQSPSPGPPEATDEGVDLCLTEQSPLPGPPEATDEGEDLCLTQSSDAPHLLPFQEKRAIFERPATPQSAASSRQSTPRRSQGEPVPGFTPRAEAQTTSITPQADSHEDFDQGDGPPSADEDDGDEELQASWDLSVQEDARPPLQGSVETQHPPTAEAAATDPRNVSGNVQPETPESGGQPAAPAANSVDAEVTQKAFMDDDAAHPHGDTPASPAEEDYGEDSEDGGQEEHQEDESSDGASDGAVAALPGLQSPVGNVKHSLASLSNPELSVSQTDEGPSPEQLPERVVETSLGPLSEINLSADVAEDAGGQHRQADAAPQAAAKSEPETQTAPETLPDKPPQQQQQQDVIETSVGPLSEINLSASLMQAQSAPGEDAAPLGDLDASNSFDKDDEDEEEDDDDDFVDDDDLLAALPD